MLAPIPANETARLKALSAYHILDTAPEPAFDELTSLLAQICNVPMATISLIDADRQWFKSHVGVSAQQTPRPITICGHAIASESSLMVVPDTARDPRFVDNPLVTGGPRVRFYAGATLRTEAGCALGTMCVMDREPRELTVAQVGALKTISRQVMRLLEARRTASECAASQELVASSEDAIFTQSLDGTIASWNRSAEEVFGWSEAEMRDNKDDRLAPPGYEGEMPGITERVRRGERIRHLETRRLTKDGRTIDVWLSVSPIHGPDGDIVGICKILRDTTDRVAAEEALRRARDAAEAASRAKGDFLANMSHELRTPLNAILGYSEMLQEQAEASGAMEPVPDLKKIHSAGKHLMSLINDVLDLSKLEAGRTELHFESFSVPLLVRDVSELIRPAMLANGNVMTVACPEDAGTMHADVTKVRQCLFNILGNAAKFTRDGRVNFAARRTHEVNGDWLTFVVMDTGVGVTPDQASRLFQPFTQADASTGRKFGGTGLGLAISRQYCRLMGGDISLRSDAGFGSTFTIRLPAAPATRRPSADERLAARTGSGSRDPDSRDARALVIDDDPQVLELMERHLAREGFKVWTATGGNEGLKLAREMNPSVITLDVRMPAPDGWDVLETLKADPSTREIPVVMLTMVDDRGAALARGAADYLVKPVERARVAEVLEKYKTDKATLPVLVVEDDPDARELIRRTVEFGGWHVIEAGDGSEALRLVADRRPALILLDLMMPNMDGFQFITELRKQDAWRSIPIIVVSARDLNDHDRQQLKDSVYQVMKKSMWDADELLARIRKLMSRHVNPAA